MKLIFDNCVYYGQVLNNKMNGVGRLNFQNGDYYIGQFADNLYNGYGEYYYASGSYYKGNWSNGKKSGKGIFHSQKFHYEGDFYEDTCHGKGIMTLQDGTVVCGNWQNGLNFGDNTFYYPNGKSLWKIFRQPGGDVRNALQDDYKQEWIDSAIRRNRQAINEANKDNYLYVKQVLEEKTPNNTATALKPNEDVRVKTNTIKISTTGNFEQDKFSTERAHQEQVKKEQEKQERLKQEQERLKQEKIEKANRLYQQAFDLFKNEKYDEAIKLLEEAKTINDESEFKSECEKLILICKASKLSLNNMFSSAIELLKLAKTISQTDRFLEQIDKTIAIFENNIELTELTRQIERACEIANNGEYARAINLFKEIIKNTDNKAIIDACEENVNQCVSAIKNIEREERIQEEYDSGWKCYMDGNYSLAIQYFRTARSMSGDYDFKKRCDQDIKDCEDAMKSEDESKAVDLYNDGVFYFNNKEMQKAKWKFEDAYSMSSDSDFRRDCDEMISRCKEYLY